MIATLPTVGTIQGSGPNRFARRMKVSFERNLSTTSKETRILNSLENGRILHRIAIDRKQTEAHQRAVARKILANAFSFSDKEVKEAKKILKFWTDKKANKSKFISKRSLKRAK